MALYTHTLYLVRESERGSLVDDLKGAGLVRSVGDELEFLGLISTTSTAKRDDGLTVLALAPDDTTFDLFLRERGNELVAWLWSAMENVGVLYAFIPGGGDFKYYEAGVSTENLMWTQLRELVDTGEVRVAHPFMMFAARLGQSRPCEKAKALDWGLREHRDGVGCLIGLTTPTEHGFEILEPGTTYSSLRDDWA